MANTHPWQHKYGWYCWYHSGCTLYLLDSFSFIKLCILSTLYCCPASFFYLKATHGSHNLGKQNPKHLSNLNRMHHIYEGPKKKTPETLKTQGAIFEFPKPNQSQSFIQQNPRKKEKKEIRNRHGKGEI